MCPLTPARPSLPLPISRESDRDRNEYQSSTSTSVAGNEPSVLPLRSLFRLHSLPSAFGFDVGCGEGRGKRDRALGGGAKDGQVQCGDVSEGLLLRQWG